MIGPMIDADDGRPLTPPRRPPAGNALLTLTPPKEHPLGAQFSEDRTTAAEKKPVKSEEEGPEKIAKFEEKDPMRAGAHGDTRPASSDLLAETLDELIDEKKAVQEEQQQRGKEKRMAKKREIEQGRLHGRALLGGIQKED
jgi:hypothetical protein